MRGLRGIGADDVEALSATWLLQHHQIALEQLGPASKEPEDAYALVFDVEQHRITAWEFTLQSGRKAHFTWSDYQTIGPLTLAMTRSNEAGDFVIRFEDVVPTP